jgi:hypothetical protein
VDTGAHLYLKSYILVPLIIFLSSLLVVAAAAILVNKKL